MIKTVRTRIAPSPTGFPHIGTVYQVLFDYVYAHKNNGQFIVRIEDTDRARFVEGAEEVIYAMLSWFGLNGDEDTIKGGPYAPYRQSERLEIYRKYADELIDKGNAYYCFCTKERLEAMRNSQEERKLAPMYDRHCRNLSNEEIESKLEGNLPYVIRMKVPDGQIITVEDMLVGEVEFKSDLIDDQVLMKADGFPTYHLAVVVDDQLMNITHIFRGREWLPSTPKHILLYRFFDWEVPEYIHLPLILNTEGKGKLSKRHGHSSVDYYRNRGYLPEALLNYLSNIVWNHPEGKEIYDLEEFTRLFEIDAISSQGARFDLKKLDWVNGQWIRGLSDKDLAQRILAYSSYNIDQIVNVLYLVKDRLNVLSDFDTLVSFFYKESVLDVIKEDLEKEGVLLTTAEGIFGKKIQTDEAIAVFKDMLLGKNNDPEKVKKMLEKTNEELKLVTTWNAGVIEELLRGITESEGWKAGEYFMVLRAALTGRTATPPLFECIEVIGKENYLNRLTAAKEIVS